MGRKLIAAVPEQAEHGPPKKWNGTHPSPVPEETPTAAFDAATEEKREIASRRASRLVFGRAS
jgi:hypothetical protein